MTFPLPLYIQYRRQRRKEFEDQIRRQRQHLGNFMKYAAWEESQNEFERARSVYERYVCMYTLSSLPVYLTFGCLPLLPPPI